MNDPKFKLLPEQNPYPDEFKSLIEEKIKSFCGRQFVFDAFANFIKNNPNGYFTVVGDAEMGKSAIAAKYIYDHHDSGKLYLSKPEKNNDNNDMDDNDDTTESLNAVAFSSNGLQVVSGSSYPALEVWDLLSKQNVLTIRGHRKLINSVAFSKDGLQVISASSDHTIKAWDVENQIQKFSLTGHKGSVNAFVISSCGKYLISASSDTTLKVWNLQSEKEIASFTGESSINCCAIAPDGTTIVAGDSSGRLHFLRLEGTEVEQ